MKTGKQKENGKAGKPETKSHRTIRYDNLNMQERKKTRLLGLLPQEILDQLAGHSWRDDFHGRKVPDDGGVVLTGAERHRVLEAHLLQVAQDALMGPRAPVEFTELEAYLRKRPPAMKGNNRSGLYTKQGKLDRVAAMRANARRNSAHQTAQWWAERTRRQRELALKMKKVGNRWVSGKVKTGTDGEGREDA